MAQPIKVKGIVIRQVNYGDYDKYAHGADGAFGQDLCQRPGRSEHKEQKQSRDGALCYSEFVLTGRAARSISLSQAECIEELLPPSGRLRGACARDIYGGRCRPPGAGGYGRNGPAPAETAFSCSRTKGQTIII